MTPVGSARIIHGDALDLPLPDASVDLVVTSPPYFGLRSYTDNGEHYAGQIGDEATPAEFVDALIAATAEMVRVLKPGGSIFVNLGDKYNSASHWAMKDGLTGNKFKDGRRGSKLGGIAVKSLMGIPWRYALRCIDDLGLILRAEIVWSKPNGLPESVTDRVRRSHEQWFHLTTQPRYFSAVDEIREEHTAPDRTAGVTAFGGRNASIPRTLTGEYEGPSPLGKLPGSVWEIATQPLKVPASLGVDHFAAFPIEWPLRIILGWSPSGICTACGEGRRPVAESTPMVVRASARRLEAQQTGNAQRTAAGGTMVQAPATRITGEQCACSDTTAPTRPAVVLDPFAGTGTTVLAAKALGREGIGVDLSRDYCRLAEWRTSDPCQLDMARERARAKGANTPLSDTDDLGLFALLEEEAS